MSAEPLELTDDEKAIAAYLELENRRRARESLLAFTMYTDPTYRPDPFHVLVAQTLDEVVWGNIRRLMIFAPPQHGKSRLVSRALPAYWLGKRSREPVALTSYGSELSEAHSHAARAIVESPQYARVFPETTVDQSSRARDHWELSNGQGLVHATGVDGVLTGHGFGLIGIDDPVKDYAESLSPAKIKGAQEWYVNTVVGREREGGATVVTMTRWAELDLAGYLLENFPGEWMVLRIPALCETQAERDEANGILGLDAGLPDPLGREVGEPCAPGRFSKETLEKRREAFIKTGFFHSWLAQYQGTPRAIGGNLIQVEKLRLVASAPFDTIRVRYWDKAGTADSGAHTAGVLMARDLRTNTYYIEDVVRGQWAARERETVVLETTQMDALRFGHVTTWVEQEPGSGGKESAENTIRTLGGYPVFAERVTGDKLVRALPFIAQCNGDNVRLVYGTWNRAFTTEAASFPTGRGKDMIDAAGGALNKLSVGQQWESAVGGQRPLITNYAVGPGRLRGGPNEPGRRSPVLLPGGYRP